MTEQTSLTGRVAVVTGGGSGIGLAIARRLGDAGATVVVGDINPSAADVAAAIGADFVEGDLAEPEASRRLIDATVSRHGTVHILVNNAGFQHVAPIDEFPEDTWQTMISLMLTAPFLLTRYAWPSMAEAGWGRVVNISSIHGLVASPYKAAYISAKHGMIGLTRTAALEGGEHGITVNAICPAYVRTPLVEGQIEAQAATRGISTDEVVSGIMLEPAAVKRLIEPEEVAALAEFLCRDEAGAITGAALTMDLGWTAR
jgi:3-hydroxybutyrate dehydrogenase